jgi:hypothetical protein
MVTVSLEGLGQLKYLEGRRIASRSFIGVKYPSGAYGQIFTDVKQLRVF